MFLFTCPGTTNGNCPVAKLGTKCLLSLFEINLFMYFQNFKITLSIFFRTTMCKKTFSYRPISDNVYAITDISVIYQYCLIILEFRLLRKGLTFCSYRWMKSCWLWSRHSLWQPCSRMQRPRASSVTAAPCNSSTDCVSG